MSACGYSFSVRSPIGRSKGGSAVHTAAYNARESLRQEEGNRLHDFSKGRSEVLFKGVFAPKEAPELFRDRQQLWNEVERFEDRSNARFARPIILSLPHELDQKQQEWILKDFIRENFTRKGMVADIAMHRPDEHGDNRNIHAHILLTTRGVDENGFVEKKNREWNHKDTLKEWREDYADRCAKMLHRAGHHEQADRWQHAHLTLPEQVAHAIERQDFDYARDCLKDPGRHKGPQVTELERRGEYIEVDRLPIDEREELELKREIMRREIDQLEREVSHDSNREDRHEEQERARDIEKDFAQQGASILERGFNEDRNADSEEKIYQPDYSGEAPPNDRPDERADIANDNSVNWTAYEGEEREAANLEAADLDSAANGASKGVGGAFSIFAKVAEKALETLTGTIENAIGGYTPRTKEDILDMRDRAADLKAWKNQEAERIDTQQREQIAANNNQETITRETMEKESSERARDYGERER